jgi:hypothetical protein
MGSQSRTPARNRCGRSLFSTPISTQPVNIPDRAIVNWFGFGWPLLYEKQFRANDESTRQNFFDHLFRLSTEFCERQVTLDMTALSSLFDKATQLNDHDRAFLNGATAADIVTAGSLNLQATLPPE